MNIAEISESDAFRNAGENRLKMLKEFLGSGKPTVEGAVRFFCEMKKEGELSQEQKNELMKAFIDGLDAREKKKVGQLISVIEAAAGF